MGRKSRKCAVFGVLLALACIFMAPSHVQASSPKISSKSLTITVGNTKALKMKNNKKKVSWRSSKSSVAKVSSKGVVTAQKKGTATVTAIIGKKKYSCKVTVKDAELNVTKLTLTANKSRQLKVAKTKGKIKWSSSNKKVATVSSKGLVKAVKAGTATISAKVASSTYKCKVTVKAASANKPQNPSNPEGPSKPEDPITPEEPADAVATSLEFYTAGGGDFICGISQSEVKFVLDADSKNVEAQILNAADEVVYTKVFEICKKGEPYTFLWDGKSLDGKYVGDNSCRVCIKAGKKETLSNKYLSMWERSDFAGGNGSEKDPYQVANLEQLEKVGQHNKCYFVQTDNIDGNYATFTAMFRDDNPFEGTYDGKGKTIANLLIKNTTDGDGSAIFYNIGEAGVLKDMALSGCSSNLSMEKAGIGYAACLAVKNSGKIQGCVLNDCKAMAVANGRQIPSYVGIVCARQEAVGSVTGCKVENGNINATVLGWGSISYAGGILADNYGKIINCTVAGLQGKSASQNGSAGIGGIGGIVAENRKGGNIIAVKVSGAVLEGTGPDQNAGGIAAWNSGQISDWSWDSSNGKLVGNHTGDCTSDNKGIITP